MAMVKLAPPWVTYANELAQLFLNDPKVHVVYDNDVSAHYAMVA